MITGKWFLPSRFYFMLNRTPFSDKLPPQRSYENVFSPVVVCVLLCVNRPHMCAKHFSQWSRETSFTLVCILWWFNGTPFWEKVSPQRSHENGCSPVCVLLCVNDHICVKRIYHNDHIDIAPSQYVFFGGLLEHLFGKSSFHTDDMKMAFPQFALSNGLIITYN